MTYSYFLSILILGFFTGNLTKEAKMNAIPIYDAKNRLPYFIHEAETSGPVLISRHNQNVAILISVSEYESLIKKANENSFIERARKFRERNKGFFTNEEIDSIFDSAKDKSINGTSHENEVFSGVMEN